MCSKERVLRPFCEKNGRSRPHPVPVCCLTLRTFTWLCMSLQDLLGLLLTHITGKCPLRCQTQGQDVAWGCVWITVC
jgi:hypothetical protein